MRKFFSCLFNKMIGSLQQSDTRGGWKDLREQAGLTLQRKIQSRTNQKHSFIYQCVFIQEIFLSHNYVQGTVQGI